MLVSKCLKKKILEFIKNVRNLTFFKRVKTSMDLKAQSTVRVGFPGQANGNFHKSEMFAI